MEVGHHSTLDSSVTHILDESGRIQYASKLELLLTLVGYAVGLGNVWRFPYLCYTYGGGAFLIPYFCALALLGYPLFVLELGLGQMFRQGTMGVWNKMGLPKLRGVGAAATVTTFVVSLYYNVILAWTVYYLGRTLWGIFSGGVLPWDDQKPGFVCPETMLVVRQAIAQSPYLVVEKTGLFNTSHAADFWCPEKGVPTRQTVVPDGYALVATQPTSCPASAAVYFWEAEALQQSSGLDDIGGIHGGMWLSYTVAWILVYVCIFKGIASSGKVVYVTATLPYIVLFIFFWRAVTLPNAITGVKFYIEPDFRLLGNAEVWLRAVTQIFFSLGVGFGSLIAFASYGKRQSDFARDARNVSVINCATSFFAGFVVFPVLGFLAHEMAQVNPCMNSMSLDSLSSVGLSGAGLAFIAFPIAVSQMPVGWLWSLLFFLMLLCLGIDSQFAMCESVITVLSDAGVGQRLPRPVFTACVCAVSYLLGLIFVTRGGVYWFQLFDYYSCIVSMFFVTFVECVGLMWPPKRGPWSAFQADVWNWTGRHLGRGFMALWRYIVPTLLALLVCLAFREGDLMDAKNSVKFPEGRGFYPTWSIYLGWFLGLLPIITFFVFLAQKPPPPEKEIEDEWQDPIHIVREDVSLSASHVVEAGGATTDVEGGGGGGSGGGVAQQSPRDTEGNSAKSARSMSARSEPDAECAPRSNCEGDHDSGGGANAEVVDVGDIDVKLGAVAEILSEDENEEVVASPCSGTPTARDRHPVAQCCQPRPGVYGKDSAAVADGTPVCGFLCGAVLQKGLPPKAAKRWW